MPEKQVKINVECGDASPLWISLMIGRTAHLQNLARLEKGKRRQLATPQKSSMSRMRVGLFPGRSRRVIVPALEEPVLAIAARGDVGDKVEDLLARELIEQSLGHDRNRRLLTLDDFFGPDHDWLGFRKRVLDHFYAVD